MQEDEDYCVNCGEIDCYCSDDLPASSESPRTVGCVTDFNDAKAYMWAASCLNPCSCEPHKGQQIADKIVSALKAAFDMGLLHGKYSGPGRK